MKRLVAGLAEGRQGGHKLFIPEEQLPHCQRLQALGTLTGSVAHDLNNVLAAIIGFSEMTLDHRSEGSRRRLHAKRVLDAAMRGRELVSQLLAFARDTAEERKPVRLNSVIRETVRMLRASMPTTISIRMDLRRRSAVVLGHAVQVQQVLMNLAMNAAYAMKENGGVLTIGLTGFRHTGWTKGLAGMMPGQYAKLVVSDTGRGIPPAAMGMIFDPFFTTGKEGEGVGLGLYVVKEIVTRYGGYITMESEEGKGSVCTVYFPIIKDYSRAAEHEERGIPMGHERILFVDDEEALVEAGEELLGGLGYDVTCRMDGAEALELFSRDPSRFDLVITDQTMPSLSGIELAQRVRGIRRGMPVILCTGYSESVSYREAKGAGISGFLMKPVLRRQLAVTVRKVLDAVM